MDATGATATTATATTTTATTSSVQDAHLNPTSSTSNTNPGRRKPQNQRRPPRSDTSQPHDQPKLPPNAHPQEGATQDGAPSSSAHPSGAAAAGPSGLGGLGGEAKPRPPRPPRPRTQTQRKPKPAPGPASSSAGGADASAPPPSTATGQDGRRPPGQGRKAKFNFGSGLTKPDSASASASVAGSVASSTRSPTPTSAHPNSNSKSTRPPKSSNPHSRSPKSSSNPSNKPHPNTKSHPPLAPPQDDSLTTTLTRALSTPPYPDCPICFSALRPEHAVWSCAPSPFTPIVTSSSGGEGANATATSGDSEGAKISQVVQYCWSSFHVRCIRSWAEKSVRDVESALRARGELGALDAHGQKKQGDWRCPGCQAKRAQIPSGYWCFCHAVQEPKVGRLRTPHSCGNSCARPRGESWSGTGTGTGTGAGGCGHPCPLACHPGPCPPCAVTTHEECYCPRRKTISFRCGADSRLLRANGGRLKRDLSCGEVCGRLLGCGKHRCERVCHEGACGGCEESEEVRCWCGRERRVVGCGEGEGVVCRVEGEEEGGEEWVGRFGCERVCERPFDCGIHKCLKPCHPPSLKPAPCPRSPERITHCPCGRHGIAPPPSPSSTSPSEESNANEKTPNETFTFPPRLACTDPIPTCSSPCSKPHINLDTGTGCGHPCEEKCHEGPCPPCRVRVVRPCRCGSTTRTLVCWEVTAGKEGGKEGGEKEGEKAGEKEILCDKPCMALRACGRHQCRRVCCPLASLAHVQGVGKKGKRKVNEDANGVGIGIGEEEGGLHECDLVCGKMLSCGLHRCERRDHKGGCGRCLRSSFEELICPCGRTIYEPPIPCGTRMECHYPCSFPPPSCGHPAVPHECHYPEGEPGGRGCPPCPHLVTKRCACGKKEVMNIRCSLEPDKVSCGTVCGKLLPCGFHPCPRPCHTSPCGPCVAPCGKMRKSCLPAHHPCTLPCHAPSACPETEPCRALVVLSCGCGRLRQSVACGRVGSSPGVGGGAGGSSGTGAGEGEGKGPQNVNPQAPKCNNDCALAKRNARLAEALGINQEVREREREKAEREGVTYGDELVAFARANPKFVGVVEKAFADFLTSPSQKRTHPLPPMPPDRRKFAHALATSQAYRMDAQLVDQEPKRSVVLVRRVDSRVPGVSLGQYVGGGAGLGQGGQGGGGGGGQGGAQGGAWGQGQGQGGLGRLGNLGRGGGGGSGAGSWRSGSATPTGANAPSGASTPQSNRGWTAVVAPKPSGPASTLSTSGWGASTPVQTGGAGSGSAGGSRTASPGVHPPLQVPGAPGHAGGGQRPLSRAGAAAAARPGSSSGVSSGVSGGGASGAGAGAGAAGSGEDKEKERQEEVVPDNWEDDV